MNQKDNEKFQRELLRAFDKELFSYTGQIAWFLPAIFSFMLLVIMCIPFQEIKNEGSIIGITGMLTLFTAFYVLAPYIFSNDSFTPQQPKSPTYEKLKYLPISKKQYIFVRMEYVFRFFRRLTIIALILHCSISVFAYHTITIENILYILVILLVLPLAVSLFNLILI